MALTACLTALASLLGAAAPAAPPLALEARALADGSNVVVARLPGVRLVSLRWMVGAGAAADPTGREGLAHLVEHLVFHGTYDLDGDRLQRDVREVGARMNAYTMANATLYSLDAPRPVFAALAAKFLRTLTNPALTASRQAREKGVVETEAALHSSFGLKNQLDAMLFPIHDQKMSVSGTRASREAITGTDIVDFFAKNYTASNTWALFAGDIGLDEAARLVDENSCLPPEAGRAAERGAAGAPRLPVDLKLRSMLTFAVYGYSVPKATPADCSALAVLLESRLRTDLVVRDPVISEVGVECTRFRGTPMVLALAYSTGLDTGALGETFDKQFAEVAARPPTPGELRAIGKHRTAARQRLLSSPSLLADSLSLEFADGERDPKVILDWVMPEAPPRPASLEKLAKSDFKDDNRLLLLFSPFQGEY